MGKGLDPKTVEKIRRLASQHEAGHAIVAWLSPSFADLDAVFVKKDVKNDGQPSAMCVFPIFGRTDREYLKARLSVLIAGPVAVQLVSGSGILGSESDMFEARQIAQDMVVKYGHSDALGNRQFPGYEVGGCTSEERKEIEDEVRKLLIEAIMTAKRMIMDNQDKWIEIVEALIQRESLNRKDIEKIMGPRPKP